MNFALITKNGKILTFFLEETAKLYQQAYGGVVFLLLDTEKSLTVTQKAAKITL